MSSSGSNRWRYHAAMRRPSQFARFMIYRNDFGGKNSFKELAPVLFTPDAPKHEIDVSGNPAS